MQLNWLGVVTSSCVVLLMTLTGCAHQSAHGRWPASSEDDLILVGDPDFDWTLTGDRRVAPLQVFSDHSRIWLQWHAGQPRPSVMVRENGQWLLVPLRQYGPFSVIDGSWRELRFQGGKLHAEARYGTSVRMAAIGSSSTQQSPALSSQAVVEQSQLPTPTATFEVRLADQTIRQTLLRWSSQHQWHFQNSHWAVPVDIPVTAKAVFQGDFIASVRALLKAVDIAGRPLQPCFYSNHVLRVISANESCDPSEKGAAGV